MSQPYEFSIATDAEAETLNDKIDAFNGKQVSFDGDVETLIHYEMVLRYAHLSSAHLRAAAERV